MKRPTVKEMITLIKRLPESDKHIYESPINEKKCVTNEFLVGAFAGRGFESDTYEESTEQLIDYLYEHIKHNSIVGKAVKESGFPDLDKVYDYCKPETIENNK